MDRQYDKKPRDGRYNKQTRLQFIKGSYRIRYIKWFAFYVMLRLQLYVMTCQNTLFFEDMAAGVRDRHCCSMCIDCETPALLSPVLLLYYNASARIQNTNALL